MFVNDIMVGQVPGAGDREEQCVHRKIRLIEQRRRDRTGALDAEIRDQGSMRSLLRRLALSSFLLTGVASGLSSSRISPACTSGPWDEKVTITLARAAQSGS
ncbi:MAG: hypothetical protein R3F54_15065 [Alphaproteobacteria bacterium]